MAGGNEDHEDSDENDDLMDSTDHSECEDLDLGDMEYFDDSNEYCSVHENLKDDIRKALATYPDSEEELGIPSVQIDETRSNLKYISAVVLTFTLKDISEHLLELWDLEDTPAIIMEMDNIHRGEFRCYGQLPTITVKKHSSEGHFIVGEQLKNFVLRLCREKFSLRSNDPPSSVGSFFSMVYGLVKERLMRLSEYCVTCGEVLSSGGVLPSICDRDLCMYQYSELHLFDGLSVPRVSPQVLSLLLFAFSNANLSHRRKDILTPAPPIKDVVKLLAEAKSKQKQIVKKGEAGDTTNKLDDDALPGSAHWNGTVSNAVEQRSYSAFNSTESATFSVLLENLPCPKEFLASVSAYHQFRKEWPMMSDVVDWLVISNRSYLEMVPRPMTVDFLHTDMQYCFVSDSPAKQVEFDRLVEQNGGKTRFFFHGSRLENWHSIIRSGLKNMSGTKYQLVGAAYGKGIYLSPFLDFAIGYASRAGGSFSRRVTAAGGSIVDRPIRSGCTTSECCDTERAEDLSCVALVEVVDCPGAYNEKTDEIFVVEEDKWCSIRMLLLYRSSDINNLHTAVEQASGGRDYHNFVRTTSRMSRAANRAAANAAAAGGTAAASGTAAIAGGGVTVQPLLPTHPPPMSFLPMPPPAYQGLMSFMMNKLSNWTGGSGGAGGGSTSDPAADPWDQLDQLTQLMGGGAASNPAAGAASIPAEQSQTLDEMEQQLSKESQSAANQGSRMLISKLAKTKKLERELRKKEEEARRSVVAAATGEMLPDVSAAAAGSIAPPTSPAHFSTQATLGSSSLSSSSSSNVIVDLTREEEEELPGTSGLQRHAERQREERMRMALEDSEEGNALAPVKGDDMKDWLEMREARRLKKEKGKKMKKKGDGKDAVKKAEKFEKDSSKRKRAMFDPTPGVPNKTSSSPSTDKPDDDLTEEDMKILEMFADSDLGEDDVEVLKGKEGNKKSSMRREEEEEDETQINEESDDDIEIVKVELSKKKQKKDPKRMFDDDDEEEVVHFVDEEEQEDAADATSSQAADAAAAAASAASSTFYPSSSSSTYTPIPVRIRPLGRRSYPPMSGPPVSSLSASSSFPPPFPFPAPPLSIVQQQQQQQNQVQTRRQLLLQKTAQLQQMRAQHQMHMSSTTNQMNPWPVPTTVTTGSTTVSSASASAAAAAAAAGIPNSASFFSKKGGMFASRRRRRGISADRGPIPGDLTTITDDQREQIYRVVRMFRNSGFEERVNRHMNREEEKKEEDGEGKNEEEGGSGDSNSPDM